MSKRPCVRAQSKGPALQMGIAFPSREMILEPKMRDEIVALLGRLLLEAARRGSEGEVRDDAS
jgi:hypothetical protein